MSTRKKKKGVKKKRSISGDFSPAMLEWMLPGMDGHPGSTEPPSPELAEEINSVFVREFKKSPMWKNMIADFGREKAEEMLKQMRVKGSDE